MSTELIINASLPETRIALMESGEIQELLIERASEKGIVGNIYKGRVTRVLPGMQAAFVDIGLEKAAFLYVDDVFVHSEIWEEEEGEPEQPLFPPDVITPASATAAPAAETPQEPVAEEAAAPQAEAPTELESELEPEGDVVESDEDEVEEDEGNDSDNESDDDDDDRGPVAMAADPNDDEDNIGNKAPAGTIAPTEEKPAHVDESVGNQAGQEHNEGQEAPEQAQEQVQETAGGEPGQVIRTPDRKRFAHKRGRRGGRSRRRPNGEVGFTRKSSGPIAPSTDNVTGRSRDRRVRPKQVRMIRGQVNIQDLLKEGQELLVQVAKDPIAAKGARLTCHISLPGRHLVCMPTIDHVGVSRRIERDDERRKLRDFVEHNRPRDLGFIVRTASGKSYSERRIKQDIDYLSRLWDEIRQKATEVTAPALVYEDLNSILRAIRDWVTEDIDKIIVDSRYHYNDVQRFVSHFMPSLKSKIELYHGDIPIFDAYNISTELSRSLEKKVWLKSGGYIVIDQAEALVAIDVNTGRYVGKKNLEDTILKTNLEAVQEIAYQLRLRNSGGIIIIDFIDMEREDNRQRVYRALDEALKKDRARPTILKISELGLVEMTRKRTRDTIIRTLCESCSHCEGKGFIKSKQTVAFEVLRELEREGIERDVRKILVQAHPDVIDILAIDERDTVDQLERRYRKQIFLQASPDFHQEQFEVMAEKRDRIQPRPETAGRIVTKPLQEQGATLEAGASEEVQGELERDHEMADQAEGGELEEDAIAEDEQGPEEGSQEESEEEGIETSESESELENQEEGVAPVVVAPVARITPRPIIASGTAEGITTGPRNDGFDNEEDRLAFLRAQAAQDAAIANMQSTTRTSVGGRPGYAKDRGRGGDRPGWGGRGGSRRPRRRKPMGGSKYPRADHADGKSYAMSDKAPPSGANEGGGGGGSGSDSSSGGTPSGET